MKGGGEVEKSQSLFWKFATVYGVGYFPVKTVELDASGAVLSEAMLSKGTGQKFEKNAFKAPKGYKRQQMDFQKRLCRLNRTPARV